MSPPLQSTQRLNQPSIRVVCLGLHRTGTSSLADALDILGYGPCYHTLRVVNSGGNDWEKWAEQYEEGGDPEVIDNILQGYSSVLDEPAADLPEILYRIYPDAKFILRSRDVGAKHKEDDTAYN
ncbi:hypothetical protein M422DRAFT_264378 [Sphaerobolus stellatus SS14]|uniref:Protein-tyrosine sulfotransferase n=1 Tax=Sphaerobolus stellatus (strain SS14) TaxID=990650 RepID=A0A0C9V8G7_SPHS4|nr:hypothetical protein M422DRAFT_264378 [Sphaerobolus stellatus SS14]